jgi:hypothetical protein
MRHSTATRLLHHRRPELCKEATHLSARSDTPQRVNFAAADGDGEPLVFDPPAVFPKLFTPHPYFRRNLRFVQVPDVLGRIRLAAMTIEE